MTLRLVNRAAFVVRPRQPYLDWAAALDATEGVDLAGSLKGRVSVYLVKEDPKEEDETPPLKDYFRRIFEAELEAWSLDENEWPENLTMKLFLEWFEVVGESMVVDLEDMDIDSEEL